jgi:hypothetical protein
MQTNENSTSKTNWAMVAFTIITGLILLSNLFNYITWDIWNVGIYIVGAIFITNVLYRKLIKRIWAYQTFQLLIFFFVLLLFIHTGFSILRPGYLKPHPPDLTAYEIYSARMELRTEYYPEVVIHKKTIVTVNEKEYTIKDSSDDYYYVRTHPPKGDSSNIFVGHRIANSDLEVEIGSTNYKLTPIQRLVDQHPSAIFGATQIPMDLEINTGDEGILNIDLKHQRIEILKGLLLGGQTNMKLSTNSLPQSKLMITIRGGEATLSLPREMSHKIKYNTKETAQLTIEGNEVVLRGEYEIISGDEENPCIVEINSEGGQMKIVTH